MLRCSTFKWNQKPFLRKETDPKALILEVESSPESKSLLSSARYATSCASTLDGNMYWQSK